MSTRMFAALLAAAVVVAVAGCARGPQSPVAVAEAFTTAFAQHDVQAAAERTNLPEKASAALNSAWDNLQAEELSARVGATVVSGDTATVEYTYEWHLPKHRSWTYSGKLQLGRSGGRWSVRWTSSNIHPKLGDTQTMMLRAEPAPRARVNEQSGSDVLVPGKVFRVTFTPKDATDPRGVASTLAGTLKQFDERLTADSISRAAQAAGGTYTVVMLSEREFDSVRGDLLGLPGVVFTSEWDLVSTDRGFAPDLLAQVRRTVIDEVDGKAGWSVVTLNANGADTDVLTEVPAQPAPSFALSVDRNVQNAAQRAVSAPHEETMMVVLRPSTGAILAVAQNEAADKLGPIATTGQFPPGSVFKTVTAAAAIGEGRARPDTVVPCPSRITVGERTIPNYDLFGLGDVSMATAYERSCNTSFAKLASELPADALPKAAAELGVVQGYTIPGLPIASGSVPASEETVQRTEDGIGQGKVVVSPFAMAMMAATVAHGSMPTPYLIDGRPTEVTGDRPEVPPEVVGGLRTMMRQVVTGGTAARIADQGEIFGKTGEAEVEGGSHAWFVGYRGDMAFATLVMKGGSSDNAVRVTRDMFAALPSGY